MSNKTTSHICSSEREFLALKGDGTESVKITPDWEKNSFLNGWYLFLRTPEGKNMFVKQSQCLPLIDRVFCETKYFQFDRNAGILPNSLYYDYRPVGLELESSRPEYEDLRGKLEQVEMWRPIREVTRWEFADQIGKRED